MPLALAVDALDDDALEEGGRLYVDPSESSDSRSEKSESDDSEDDCASFLMFFEVIIFFFLLIFFLAKRFSISASFSGMSVITVLFIFLDRF